MTLNPAQPHPKLQSFRPKGWLNIIENNVLPWRNSISDVLCVVSSGHDVLAMKFCAAPPTLDGRRRPERSPQLFRAAVARRGHVERDLEERIQLRI